MVDNVNDILHSGVAHDENPPGRGSGRYGWGTGANPGQHQFNVLSEVERLRKNGFSDSEIAKMLLHDKATPSELKNYIIANTDISLSKVRQLESQGKTDKEIAQILLGRDATVNDLKAKKAIATKRERMEMVNKVIEEYAKTQTAEHPEGNKSEVARKLDINESSVRSYLNEARASNTNKYWQTADQIKAAIDKSEYGFIDVSKGTEIYLGVTDNTKKVAISLLQEEGYVKTWVKIPQLGTNESTTLMVLAAPPKEGETVHDINVKVQKNKYSYGTIDSFSPDGGKTFFVPEYPSSMSSDRIYLRKASEGGKDKDGVIEIRKGVEDLSLGNSQYAQVRIAVDGTHYMKGMAMYSDDIPKGYDVVYNTSKPDDWPMIGPDKNKEVLKRLKDDKDNPFGATIKAGGQSYYKDPNGNYISKGDGYVKAKKNDTGERYSLSPVNKINEEGDWDTWSRNLSSQFLSKQSLKLINQQIDLTIASKKAEYDEIMNLTNPVIKKKLLNDFADQCDKQSADLAVKGFKNQAFQVILPVTDLKENEIYAQNFKDGDTVALVRYPHAGIFEIPILTVNNKNPSGKKILGQARDAVGINPKTAQQLSGADFDGDTVIVIPMKSNNIKISSKSYPKELIDWDFHEIYRLPDGVNAPKESTKQQEMGKTTNLLMDMTLAGAPMEDIIKVVKHSMVVIDMVKHRLDYKQSEKDNDIIALKKDWQGKSPNGQPKGASTIITKAKAQSHPNKRREITRESDMTPEELKAFREGKRVYRSIPNDMAKRIKNESPEQYTKEVANILGIPESNVKSYIGDRKRIKDPEKMTPEEKVIYESGRKVYRQVTPTPRTQKVPRMYTVDDAMELVRDPLNNKEVAYANYANTLKDMANRARIEYRSIKPTKVDPVAKVTYKKEVEDLMAALRVAKSNAPRERKAQALGNKILQEKVKCNPELENDSEHYSREKNRSLTAARAAVGASKEPIVITDRQWQAIQANALSANTVHEILMNSDADRFRDLATPKNQISITPAKLAKAKAMMETGMYTNKEIAEDLGISTSTLYKYLNE